MPPPQLFKPEYFLREIVDRKVMKKLLDRIARKYEDLFMEIIYRAHHNSFKVSYADIFYTDFVRYIVTGCRLKKRVFWKYLPESSALRYMYEERRRFLNYLKKPPEKRKYHMVGDIRWSFKFWLSQLSFWYGTVRAFANVWKRVVLEGKTIPREVDLDEAITLYIISDFVDAFLNSQGKCVRKKWVPKYEEYIKKIEKGSQT